MTMKIPVRLCNYLDVYYNDRITDAIDFSPGSATRQEIERFALLPGDVVITKDSELRDDIAVPALVEESGAGTVCGYHLAIIRPNSRRASGSFLFWALWSRPVAEQFANQAKGVTRFGLTLHGIGSVRVPVPHLQMQKRIAVFLDRETARIEELINRKQRMNSLLDDMEQALLETLVS